MNIKDMMHEPIANLKDIERLKVYENWEALDPVIQNELKLLDEKVILSVPNAVIRNNHHSSNVWLLFSYRTYEINNNDPIVVGMTIAKDKNYVVYIIGDIAREESGTILCDDIKVEITEKITSEDAITIVGKYLLSKVQIIIDGLLKE